MLLAQILEMDLCPADEDINASREGKSSDTIKYNDHNSAQGFKF